MTDLGVSLHAWLDRLDSANNVDWYEHLISKSFRCGCQTWTTYCEDWQRIIAPPAPVPGTAKAEAHSAWVHTNSTPMPDELLQLEIPRRRYVVLNPWEHGSIPRIKELNPDCQVFVYKDISSVRSGDTHADPRLMPAGVSYAYAKTQPTWQARSAGGAWLQYDGYQGHWQMDVGQRGYQDEWAGNVARVAELGFDGVWLDNALWKRDTYHPGFPVRAYATDEAFRYAYLSFFLTVCPRLRAAGLLSVANMTNARLVTNGWQSYLDAGLDGAFDEFWLSVDNTGTNLLPEYEQGWKRQVAQVAYAESKGKIAIVQPHFPAGNVKAFRYFMAYPTAGKAAIVEANGTDQYGNPTAWHPEYDWNLGTPSGAYRSVGTNVFRRDFTAGCVIVNANKTGSPEVTVPLNGNYVTDVGHYVTQVYLAGTSGTILRKT